MAARAPRSRRYLHDAAGGRTASRIMGRTVCRSRASPRCASIVSGVTASLALIEAAIAAGADAMLVHHGLFWRGQDGRVTGWLKQRAGAAAGARHQPVRLPPAAGRAPRARQQRAARRCGWGWRPTRASASRTWASSAAPAQPLTRGGAGRAAAVPARRAPPLVVPGDGRPLQRVAWCTGGAQGYFEAAIAAGADAFLTGEISEPQAHWRARPAWPSSPAATTPPSATARRRWRRTWRRSSASSTSSSTSTTRPESA